MEAARDVARLVEIMAALRAPVGGCPWDLEQSFETIAPYTIEEAYEVADAIERRDAEDLREELGDLLLQVVYHCQLAAERGWFSFDDVVEGITRKMIRRHPHVFGDAVARSAGSAKGQWERIKAEERAEKAARRADAASRAALNQPTDDWLAEARANQQPLLLDAVPSGFPALTLSLKVQQRAAKVGFDWDAAAPIMAKIAEELSEFRVSATSGDRTEMSGELGDILFSVVNLARFHDIDPELALRGCVRKFRRRFDHIERAIAGSGRSLTEASLSEMEDLWVEAKRGERDQPVAATLTSG